MRDNNAGDYCSCLAHGQLVMLLNFFVSEHQNLMLSFFPGCARPVQVLLCFLAEMVPHP